MQNNVDLLSHILALATGENQLERGVNSELVKAKQLPK